LRKGGSGRWRLGAHGRPHRWQVSGSSVTARWGAEAERGVRSRAATESEMGMGKVCLCFGVLTTQRIRVGGAVVTRKTAARSKTMGSGDRRSRCGGNMHGWRGRPRGWCGARALQLASQVGWFKPRWRQARFGQLGCTVEWVGRDTPFYLLQVFSNIQIFTKFCN
jgi:hypothetical protein